MSTAIPVYCDVVFFPTDAILKVLPITLLIVGIGAVILVTALLISKRKHKKEKSDDSDDE